MEIRARQPSDLEDARSFLLRHDALLNARRGELVAALDHPAFVAVEETAIVGLLTYILNNDECEVLTLHSDEQWSGIGTRLLEAVEDLAVQRGCSRLWLVTTNDNLDALRFYQRRGFRITTVCPGAVTQSRAALKPEIPEVGAYGIPLRDEIELVKRL